MCVCAWACARVCVCALVLLELVRADRPGARALRPDSMLLVEERLPFLAAAPEREGRGRLRYCRVERALDDR